MNIKKSLGLAIKESRKAKKITQEDFSEISSRTYISTLERGLYSPTIEKVDAIAKVIGIHPLSLLTLAYLIETGDSNIKGLMVKVESDLKLLHSD